MYYKYDYRDSYLHYDDYSGAGDQEDLEDGEIFDDDEEQIPTPQPLLKEESAPPPLLNPALLPPPKQRKLASPHINDRAKRPPPKARRGKRTREDDRQFQSRKRRRSIEEKHREKETLPEVDNESLLREDDSPPRDWDRSDVYILDEEDEELCGPTRRTGRGGRDFSGGRPRRMRQNRGGRRGGGNSGGGGGGGGSSRRDHNMGKFFMQGKNNHNQRNNNAHRRFEMCKFYMNDCCAKKDKCLYMHSDFPCKFHHLGLKCYAGKRCKFSHLPVTPFVKQMLVKHNQSESDKHFLLHLETMSPNRGSPEQDFRNDFHHSDHHMDYEEEENHHQHHRDEFYDQNERNMPPHFHDNRNHPGQNSRFDDNEMHQNQGYFHHNRQRQDHSSEDEGNRTPMPSPEHLSDRENRTPEVEAKPEPPRSPPANHSYKNEMSENKENTNEAGNKSEIKTDMPLCLPQKQRELFIRIQQHQKEETELTQAEKDSANKDEEYKEDDWYSSDDEGGSSSLNTILKTIKQPSQQQALPVIKELPDIDMNAVTKLLQSIKQSSQITTQTVKPSDDKVPQNPSKAQDNSKPEEKSRRFRDPRLARASGTNAEDKPKPTITPVLAASISPLGNDVDLRLTRPAGSVTPTDVDLRQLPFKPAPDHQAANEIDASITAFPPILNYVLKPIPPLPKPDYSRVQFKSPSDPRLKKFSLLAPPVKPVVPATTVPFVMPMTPTYTENVTAPQAPAPAPALAPRPVEIRDPRQRALANDPRRKAQQLLQQQQQQQQQLPQQQHPPLQHPHPPMMPHQQQPPIRFPMQPPMYHQRGDSDLRNPGAYGIGDIDLRFHQPPTAPHFAYK